MTSGILALLIVGMATAYFAGGISGWVVRGLREQAAPVKAPRHARRPEPYTLPRLGRQAPLRAPEYGRHADALIAAAHGSHVAGEGLSDEVEARQADALIAAHLASMARPYVTAGAES